MKKLIPTFVLAFAVLSCLAFVVGGSACKELTPESLTPEQRTEAEALKARHEKARADEQAAATPEAKADAAKVIHMTEAEMDAFESRVLMERAGPIVAGLSAIHPALGWLNSLMPLVPLAGKRGRKHFWNAIKDVSPWAGPEDGAQKGIAPIAAVEDLLRMWGVFHSSEESKEAFEGPKVDGGSTVSAAGSPA